MRRWLALFAALTMFAALAIPATANETPDRFDRDLSDSIADLRLDSPITVDGGSALDASLLGATGEKAVIVRLAGDSLAESGATSDRAQSRVVRDLERSQQRFADRMARDHGAVEIASVQRVLNAVFLQVDAGALADIAADSDVVRVAPVANYELDLNETVPYIGASAVQADGVDGSDIKVAVLDSGIDYTHAAFGGAGTLAAYEAAYGTDPSDSRNTTRDGLFPTAKVVGGYDFVGEVWPNGPNGNEPDDLAPDPDPIDFEGHGTHVADIIGGELGVAPGVDLYAVKVCSAVDSACSGVALIQGMEFVTDPNMDGKVKDRVDIVNMSLGALYGQPFDDDLAAAVDNATALGILTVASAGNSSNKPYISGTPGGANTALSVAQTYVPSATVQGIKALEPVAGEVGAVFQDWSAPLVADIGPAPLLFAGDVGDPEGCSVGPGGINDVSPGSEPFAPGSLSGQIVLVDRGTCNFSTKIFNVQRGGGLAGIIGLVAPGEPFTGALGAGGPFTIPGYMVGEAESDFLKASTLAEIRTDGQIPAIGNVVGSSSRGPSNFYQRIKPEIGAPGASVSALVGSGTGTESFGGTSGAAPMVAGSAALVLDANGGTKTTGKGTPKGKAIGHGLKPHEVKALLMNNGETEIGNSAFTSELAPITRLGGGEVRPNRAIEAPVAAWDDETGQGALSFGQIEVAQDTSITKTVRIKNLENKKRTYTVTPTFRFENDELNGAVAVSAPSSVTVKPGKGRDTLFDVTLSIDAEALRGNYMNSGSQGANGDVLTLNEYDGYLILDDGDHPVHLAWQVLPRQAAEVVPETTSFAPGGFPTTIGLGNQGAGVAQNDAFSIVALSPDIPEGPLGGQSPTPDIRAVGVTTITVPAGFCSGQASFIWAFAINTWEEQSHLVPVSHQVDLDVDGDGEFEWTILNRDAAAGPPGFNQLGDGRQLTWAIGESSASAFFFAEHATNTGNTVLYICGEQVGLTGTDLLSTNVNARVTAQDFYFGGPSDETEVFTITPLGERFFGLPSGDIPGGGSGSLDIFDFEPFPGNTPELGVMLITNGDRGTGARGGATDATDVLLFTVS